MQDELLFDSNFKTSERKLTRGRQIVSYESFSLVTVKLIYTYLAMLIIRQLAN